MVAVHEKLVREELEGVHRVLCGRVGEARQLRRRGGGPGRWMGRRREGI